MQRGFHHGLLGRIVLCAAVLGGTPGTGIAEDGMEIFAGALGGVSALSPDTTSSQVHDTFRFSTYAPSNGLAAHVVVGLHVTDYVTVQAGYAWNRNALRFESAVGTPRSSDIEVVGSESRQHGLVGEFLLYFRARDSWVRPYLSVGIGAVRLSSTADRPSGPPPRLIREATFSSVTSVVPVAVGIDVAIGPHWSIRYTFSEGISANPLGDRLTPPGERVLMNFRNLVGGLYRF